MKRETRPFTVEVRRGSKKQSAPFLPPPEAQTPATEKNPLQRAEEILFSREPGQGPDRPAPPRTGRILEPVEQAQRPEEAQPEPEPATEAPRRRGRPPGSKNRSATVEGVERPGRGRPRSTPEGRRLKLTPELINAAMDSMTKVASAPSAGGSAAARGEAELEGLGVDTERPSRRPRQEADLAHEPGGQLPLLDEDDAFAADAPSTQTKSARRQRAADKLLRAGLGAADVRRLFKPGERWRGRMLLRALARRRRSG
jgi:hypothetical protein